MRLSTKLEKHAEQAVVGNMMMKSKSAKLDWHLLRSTSMQHGDKFGKGCMPGPVLLMVYGSPQWHSYTINSTLKHKSGFGA